MPRLRSGAIHAKTTDEYIHKAKQFIEIPEPQRKAQSHDTVLTNFDFGFTESADKATETSSIELPLVKKTILIVNTGPPMTSETFQSIMAKDKAKSSSRSRASTSDSLTVDTPMDFDFFTQRFNQMDRVVVVHFWILNNLEHPHVRIYIGIAISQIQQDNCKFDALIRIQEQVNSFPMVSGLNFESLDKYIYVLTDNRLFDDSPNKEKLDLVSDHQNLWNIVQVITR